jgi:hypothetical protein
MTDHSTIDTLREAFEELERRCDAYQPAGTTPLRRRSRTTPLLIAASAVVVAALAVLAATRLGLGPNHRHTAAGGAPAVASAALTTAPGHHSPATSRGPERGRTSSATAVHHGARPTGPGRSDSISQTFATVLHQVAGASASFTTAPESNRTFLLGELTVDGVTGGFDIQYFRAGRGQRATCDDMDRVQCHVSSPARGGSLATGEESLQTDPGGVTRQAVYVRTDGTEFVMHVSNAADPKGAGSVGPKPPLTTDQMVAIVTSQQW